MANVGPWEILVIAIVALLVFGPNRLPELGRSLGRAVREFRRASQELKDEVKRAIEEEPPPARLGASPAPGQEGQGGGPVSREAARTAEEQERY